MSDQSQGAADVLGQHLQVAKQAIATHGAALQKMHGDIQNAQGADDKHQQLLQAIATLGQGQGMGAPGDSQDAAQQAVWSQYPSTDPSTLQHLASQSQSPEDLIGQWAQLQDGDEQKFKQAQLQNLMTILHSMSAPTGDPSQPAPVAPGVGGDLGG